MSIFIAIFIIGIIIMFHEFGHFLAAKLCGVGVSEFALGMGPMLFGRRLGETVYALRLIPLGGFCAMYGETAVESTGKDKPAKKGWRHPEFKTDWDESRSYLNKPKWKQILIALAGPGFNVLMAFAACMALAGLPSVHVGNAEIIRFGPVQVVQEAGLEIGDVIVGVDGRDVKMPQEYSNYLATHPRTKTDGYVLRVYRPSDGETHEFYLIPDQETGLVGLTYKGTDLTGPMRRYEGGYRILRNSVIMSVDSVAMLLRGDAGLGDMSSIIGVAAAIGDTVDQASDVQAAGFEEGSETAVAQAILSMMVYVSIALAVMNLLPLPALDGGRALICLGEWISGRNMPERMAYLINGVCMLVLCVFMGIIMISDLVRIVSDMLA